MTQSLTLKVKFRKLRSQRKLEYKYYQLIINDSKVNNIIVNNMILNYLKVKSSYRMINSKKRLKSCVGRFRMISTKHWI